MSSATDVDLQKVLRDNGFDNSELRMRSWELNCTVPTILEFPALFRKKNILHPTLCGIFSLYLFIMLGVLCNDYLVPSMERLCYALRMTYDVAGATFLAAATSTPELFVNFVGTFVTEGDIGVAAIVGSSVFNTLAVAAVCGIFTGVSEQLDWWPITRDIIWYLIAIAALCAVLYDANVSAIESGLMLACYFCYLLLLVLDRVIQSFFRGDNIYTTQVTEDPLDREESPLMSFRDHVCRMPGEESGKCAFIWWVIKYPCALILALTIPSVRTFYFLTMLMAIIWIGATCYLLTWFLTVIGYNIGIPDTLMGLTVLAAGTSVPEAISSYILTKKGYGAMAIGNAIGSNTFDILVCLGLPWILKALILNKNVIINSSGLAITASCLAVTAIMLYLTFLLTKFVLGKTVGWLSLVTYVLFLIVSCAMEMYLQKPVCNIESEEYAYLTKDQWW